MDKVKYLYQIVRECIKPLFFRNLTYADAFGIAGIGILLQYCFEHLSSSGTPSFPLFVVNTGIWFIGFGIPFLVFSFGGRTHRLPRILVVLFTGSILVVLLVLLRNSFTDANLNLSAYRPMSEWEIKALPGIFFVTILIDGSTTLIVVTLLHLLLQPFRKSKERELP